MLSDVLEKDLYQALLDKDANYNSYYVGVKTTGIFCRFTCNAKKPKLENCEFFSKIKDAIYASYRCCKRCQPLALSESITELVVAVEAQPQRHWKTYDFKTYYPQAMKSENDFKSHFDMTFIEYARARRMGLAMKHVRAERILSNHLEDPFCEFIPTSFKLSENTNNLKIAWLDTIFGPMVAIADEKGLYLLEFVERRALETEIKKLRAKLRIAILPGRNAIINQIELELKNYFMAKTAVFNTPLHIIGTDFQKQVWEQFLKIPVGDTKTYSDIAQAVNSPRACRAVGQASGANQLAIVIPCHRIVNTDGSLGGYGGGLGRKERLLALEKKIGNCSQRYTKV